MEAHQIKKEGRGSLGYSDEDIANCEDVAIGIDNWCDDFIDEDLEPLKENPLIEFQGIHFDFKASRTAPIEVLTGDKLTEFKPLLDYLVSRESLGLLIPGKIIYADDQFVNQHMMKRHFLDIGIPDSLITFSDGEGVVTYFEQQLKSRQECEYELAHSFPHVALVLLDINMPLMNGFQTLEMLTQLFRQHNQRNSSVNNMNELGRAVATQ